MSSENENQIGKNPQSIELHRIYKLHPNQVELGLGYLINQRRIPLFEKNERGETTLEDEWQLQALHAVSSILDSNIRTFEQESNYREAVEATLRYMRFLGYSETDLTAQGIIAAEEKEMEEAYADLGIDTEAIKRGVPNLWLEETTRLVEAIIEEGRLERLEGKKIERDPEPDRFPDLTEQDQSFLRKLDILMDIYDEFPTFEKYSNLLNKLEKYLKTYKKKKTWKKRKNK